jgi:superoxide dismutase, Fe-Mn family
MRDLIELIEARGQDKIELVKLPYTRGDLYPVLSSSSIDYHYGKLARGYVDRYNSGEGDKSFNEAGAYLHNLFFPQLRAPKSTNKPVGGADSLIKRKYGNFENFKKEFAATAMKIQGSGWVYMSRSGEIKTITNHQKRTDIALLIDWWEHSWSTDYLADKAKYLKNMWRIINWDIVNQRL